MNDKTIIKTKRIFSKIIVVLLALAGIALLAYPHVSNWLSERNHSKLIQQYKLTVEQLEAQEIERELSRAIEYNRLLAQKPVTDPYIPDYYYASPMDYESILNIDGIMGYIEIPAIDAFLPIYHGVSEAVLQKGIGHMNATAFPIGGEGCHGVLTGHRGLPSSELFSYLVELKEGDMFYIHVLGEVYAYKAVFIKTINPDETNYLVPQEGRDLLTLITCTPYSINSHRFLVTGEKVEDHEVVNPINPSRVHKICPICIMLMIAVVQGNIAAALWVWRNKQTVVYMLMRNS